jgi:hypothetical protein
MLRKNTFYAGYTEEKILCQVFIFQNPTDILRSYWVLGAQEPPQLPRLADVDEDI